MDLTLPQLEQAINYWRMQRPAVGEQCALSAEVNALASVYALMIHYGKSVVPVEELSAEVRGLLEAGLRVTTSA